MAKISELYTGGAKFITMKELSKKPIVETITKIVVNQGKFNKEKPRLDLVFGDSKRKISLNSHSAMILAEKWGDDTDKWVGRKVKITKGLVPFGDGEVSGKIIEPA